MQLREKEDREKELLKAKGGPRAPDEWRMKGMREDASDVSWIIEDSASAVGYSGKMLTQKKAQYVVMVARKQSKEVLVMPVERWFKFDRQTKKKSAERRLQEQRARTNFNSCCTRIAFFSWCIRDVCARTHTHTNVNTHTRTSKTG